MAYICDHCKKGSETGNAVSHAKNRVKRLFRPNLQKLKVLKNGIQLRVRFCTRCIKRLRRDGRIGAYSVMTLAAPKVTIEKAIKAVLPQKKKETKKEAIPAAPALDISAIVGKKS